MKYVNTRSKVAQVAVAIEFNEKFKTYTLTLENGDTIPVTSSTFKRWWKKVEDDESEATKAFATKLAESLTVSNEIPSLAEEIGLVETVASENEDVCADGRTYAEIGVEIAEQAKEKAKKAKGVKKAKETKEKIDTLAIVERVLKELNLEYKRSEREVVVHNGKKRVIDMWKRSTKVRVYISDKNDKYEALVGSGLVEDVHDNPVKSSLNKSFYVTAENIEAVLRALA